MYGADGLRALIREHVRLAQLFASWVEAEPGWEVVCAASLLDCLLPARRRPTTTSSRAARRRPAKLFVATTRLRGEAMIRLAIGNAQTTEDDVRLAWEVLCDSVR